MTTHTLTRSFLTKPLEIIASFFVNVFKSLQAAQMKSAIQRVRAEMMRHSAYRETYNELSKLTDNELNDIGISRGDIHFIAMESHLDDR